ncbi:4-amino-4-deoxychorismate lyase [Bifidobacterium minimum]|jgi:4-amino-4-deoxychorismate lyase|uniref:4-amino-4-deoxychorismate lyase n=1 Tax=Bifidobacterium minimum TaxID=1693 RepID=A0A087BNC8_9BIFI|nr:aminodeoxychorismate lyase [Bifidobacterium minimum]KFI72528.1 4-amino-4-deoxychorismate lyase [Bifidobacterium minimum]MCH4159580.1 aminodeoxychorismate lyase [Bifidobacterium minimum]
MTAIVLAVGNPEALFGSSTDDPVRFVEPTDTPVSVFDLSVLRGDGIFEATTVWKGFPVSLENHLRRLADSARLMDMPQPSIAAFTTAVEMVIDRYDDPEPGPMLRILISRGMDPTTGVGENSDRMPRVWIFLDGRGKLHSLDPLTLTSLTRGYASDITAKAPWLLNGAKTLSYAVNQSIHRECDRRHVDDAIMVTTDGYTLECPNSSIVARYDDLFVTPDPRIGILNGTSQRELFSYARREGMRTDYRKLPLAELREADMLYMTHGGWIIPISRLDGRDYTVDAAEVDAINEAVHSGRTHDDALSIAPTGDYAG